MFLRSIPPTGSHPQLSSKMHSLYVSRRPGSKKPAHPYNSTLGPPSSVSDLSFLICTLGVDIHTVLEVEIRTDHFKDKQHFWEVHFSSLHRSGWRRKESCTQVCLRHCVPSSILLCVCFCCRVNKQLIRELCRLMACHKAGTHYTRISSSSTPTC